MFRPLTGHLQALVIQIQTYKCSMRCGTPNVHRQNVCIIRSIQTTVLYDKWVYKYRRYIIINQQDAALHSQFYFTAGSLNMFRVLSTPIIRSTLNCIYSLRYRSYYRWSYLLPTWPNLATSEEGSYNDNMTCTGGCRYSLMYSS